MKNVMIKGLLNDYYDLQEIRVSINSQLWHKKEHLSEQEEIFMKENVYKRVHDIEKDIAKYIGKEVKNYPIYTEWLEKVKGIGPILSSGLISYLGDDMSAHKETIIIGHGEERGKEKEVVRGFATISKLWAYAGLTVNPDGTAKKLKKGEKVNWNPKLKTLSWLIGEAFVKTKSGYRDLYDKFRSDYEKKWTSPEKCKSIGCKNKGKCLDGHKYAAAKRKTVKVFLAHYHQMCNKLMGLPIQQPYIIGRLGHEHEIPIIIE